jgi:hypothetical protein
MYRRWELEIHGRVRLLEIDWDLLWTNRGRARIDGVQIAKWWRVHNFPGVTTTLSVDGVTIDVLRMMVGFDIDLSRSPGARVLDPPLSPGHSPIARMRSHQIQGIIVLALVLGLPCLVGAVVSILALLRMLR